MYAFSTKSGMEKHGCSGLSRIISVVEGAQLIRFDPPNLPNSRSILGLQKNGRDVETYAERRAETFAVFCAEPHADIRAVVCADGSAKTAIQT